MRLRENFTDSPAAARAVPAPVHSLEPVAGGTTARARVAWAMPCYGPIFPQVYASHLSAIAYASRYFTVERIGDFPMVGATDRMYLHSAANEIVRQSLAEPSITHIFWTESDMILPHDVVPKLLDMGKRVAAGIYFLRGGTGQPCLYKRTPMELKENPYLHTPITIYDERGPFKVDCPGMGCVLIETSVFREIEEPWFDLKANDAGKKNGYGQDLYFFTKVRWKKIDVWANPAVISDQIDTTVVGYKDYRRRLAEDKGIGSGGFIAIDAAVQDGTARKG
jgi:hypothetical protein